jgi:hypothetical protein
MPCLPHYTQETGCAPAIDLFNSRQNYERATGFFGLLLFDFNCLIFNEIILFCMGVARMYPGMRISLNALPRLLSGSSSFQLVVNTFSYAVINNTALILIPLLLHLLRDFLMPAVTAGLQVMRSRVTHLVV